MNLHHEKGRGGQWRKALTQNFINFIFPTTTLERQGSKRCKNYHRCLRVSPIELDDPIKGSNNRITVSMSNKEFIPWDETSEQRACSYLRTPAP